VADAKRGAAYFIFLKKEIIRRHNATRNSLLPVRREDFSSIEFFYHPPHKIRRK